VVQRFTRPGDESAYDPVAALPIAEVHSAREGSGILSWERLIGSAIAQIALR